MVEGDAPTLYLEAVLVRVVHTREDRGHHPQCLEVEAGQGALGAGVDPDYPVVQDQDHTAGQCPGLDLGHAPSPLALVEVVGEEVLVRPEGKGISAKIVGPEAAKVKMISVIVDQKVHHLESRRYDSPSLKLLIVFLECMQLSHE